MTRRSRCALVRALRTHANCRLCISPAIRRFLTVTACVTWVLLRYPLPLAADCCAGDDLRRVSQDVELSNENVVGVTTDKEAYRTAEVIGVSIINGLDQVVRASSQYSYCTIVTLERKRDDSWESVAPCVLLRMAATIDIEPGKTARLRLPASEQPEPRPQAGTYRIAFRHDVLDRERSKHLSEGIVYSESFTVSEN